MSEEGSGVLTEAAEAEAEVEASVPLAITSAGVAVGSAADAGSAGESLLKIETLREAPMAEKASALRRGRAGRLPSATAEAWLSDKRALRTIVSNVPEEPWTDGAPKQVRQAGACC